VSRCAAGGVAGSVGECGPLGGQHPPAGDAAARAGGVVCRSVMMKDEGPVKKCGASARQVRFPNPKCHLHTPVEPGSWHSPAAPADRTTTFNRS